MTKRTPRNFDGTALPGKKIGELLPEVLSKISPPSGNQIYTVWFSLLGEKMAPLTEPVSWVDGVLTVKVKSATLYSLLCQHEKARLLQRLKEQFPIRNLKFRIG